MQDGLPLVGRARELAAGRRATAGALVLVGPAGVGTTRLARELVAAAAADGCPTRWVSASRAAAGIGFGAVAQLIPAAVDPVADGFAVLRRTAEHLARERRLVLGVDDAHLLDDSSAALIHHLLLAGDVRVVLTLHAGEPAPDAIVALVKDGPAERIEVRELAPGEARELLEACAGGPLDGLTAARLQRAGGGHPRRLAELVRAGLDSGALADHGGVRRWSGELAATGPHTDRLAERVRARPAPEQRLLELLAASGEGPLDLDLLQRAGVDPATVEAAEASGLVRTRLAGDRIEVGPVDPLTGPVVLAGTSPLRARRACAALASAAAAAPAAAAPAPAPALAPALALARWHLDGAMPAPPGLLASAAELALVRFDHPLAGRLAAAAEPSWTASFALARALAEQGAAEQAEAVYRTLTGGAVAVALARAENLFGGLGRSDAAHRVLDEAAARLGDPTGELASLRARFAACPTPDPAAAQLARTVLDRPEPSDRPEASDRPEPSDRARAECLVVLAQCLLAQGRSIEAIAAGQRAVEAAGTGPGWSDPAAALFAGYLAAGRHPAATALAESGYQRALAAGGVAQVALWACLRGEALRARGELAAALRLFREAAALGRGPELGPRSDLRRRVLAALARGAAQAGEPVVAQAALNEAGPEAGPEAAWVAAARGDGTGGIELALAAARAERRRGNAGFEFQALHDAARLGAAARVAVRLAELAPGIQGAPAALIAEQVARLAARDGAGLDLASAALARAGHPLLAAEASIQAAGIHRAACRSLTASASAGRARSLLAACPGARTPALTGLRAAPVLTRRENEIARLAATGLSSRVIASRLTVAVRTVDNTLGVVYAKLAVRSRRDLAAALAPLSDPL